MPVAFPFLLAAMTLVFSLLSPPARACVDDFPAAAPTPATGPGPYYPGAEAFAGRDNDLTRGLAARGTVLVIEGTVVDGSGAPLAGAAVHLWQADGLHGRYEHPRVPETVPRDPGFGYFGGVVTDTRGRYRFRTVLPPPYPAGPDWQRSRHVHFAVHGAGRPVLFTELHFAGDGTIAQDRFLLRAVPDLSPLLVPFAHAPFSWSDGEPVRDTLVGHFDLVL